MKGIRITCIVLFAVIALLIAANVFLFVKRESGSSDYVQIKPSSEGVAENTAPQPVEIDTALESFVAKEGMEVNDAGAAGVSPIVDPAQQPAVPDAGTAPQATSAVQAATADNNPDAYIFPESNSAFLKKSQLKKLSVKKLRLARNELYARHGYIFKDEKLYSYFSKKSWYVPKVDSDKFKDSDYFNKYEIANRNLIKKMESKK